MGFGRNSSETNRTGARIVAVHARIRIATLSVCARPLACAVQLERARQQKEAGLRREMELLRLQHQRRRAASAAGLSSSLRTR